MKITLGYAPLLFLLAPSLVQGDVVISEIADKGTSNDVCGGNDWIELYNNGEMAVSLDGYGMYDDRGVGNAETFSFPSDAVINSQEYLLLCTELKIPGTDEADPISPQFGISGDDSITLTRSFSTENSNSTEAAVSTSTTRTTDTIIEVIDTVGPLPNTHSRFGVSYALEMTTGSFNYTQTPTPGSANVISELLTGAEILANLKSSLKAQNEMGTNFFGMDDSGSPVEDEEFPVVLELHVNMSEQDYGSMMGNASWEVYKPFASATLRNPETGADVWTRTSSGRIRTKGQSTLFMGICLGTKTIPFQLDLSSNNVNETMFGSEKVYLRHHLNDYSFMRDHFYHRMLARFGLPHLRSRKAQLFINGQSIGFYTLMEAPDQAHVFARNFPSFDPYKYALYKVKSYAQGCGYYTEEERFNATIRLEELQEQAQEPITKDNLPPLLFERGEQNEPVEVLSIARSEQCFDNFLNDLWKTWVDVVVAWEINDEDCGEALVEEGLIDLDLGTNDYENNMKDFVNQFYRGDNLCDDGCTNHARINNEMDVQHALRTIAFYAVLVVSDSPIISGNNFYLANAGDNLGWKFQAYDFNEAAVRFCADDVCNARAVHWSIARPTCTSLEDSFLIGPLLSDPDNHQQYLEYSREFLDTILTNASLIQEIQDHAAAIMPYVRDDTWSFFGAFFGKELTPDAADWREEGGRFPLLATMKARAEDLQEQFAAIDAGTFPRGPHIGVIGENEAWEPCADWRATEANRSACEQGCMYEGCHMPGWTVESYCDEETGQCFHGDYDELCDGLYDGERYPGMADTEDGRPTFCRFAKGTPTKAAECPVPGAVTLSSSNTDNESMASPVSCGKLVLSLILSLNFVAVATW